jgi:hypothetical protein
MKQKTRTEQATMDREQKKRTGKKKEITHEAPAPVRPMVVRRSADAPCTTANLGYITVGGLDWKEGDLKIFLERGQRKGVREKEYRGYC